MQKLFFFSLLATAATTLLLTYVANFGLAWTFTGLPDEEFSTNSLSVMNDTVTLINFRNEALRLKGYVKIFETGPWKPPRRSWNNDDPRMSFLRRLYNLELYMDSADDNGISLEGIEEGLYTRFGGISTHWDDCRWIREGPTFKNLFPHLSPNITPSILPGLLYSNTPAIEHRTGRYMDGVSAIGSSLVLHFNGTVIACPLLLPHGLNYSAASLPPLPRAASSHNRYKSSRRKSKQAAAASSDGGKLLFIRDPKSSEWVRLVNNISMECRQHRPFVVNLIDAGKVRVWKSFAWALVASCKQPSPNWENGEGQLRLAVLDQTSDVHVGPSIISALDSTAKLYVRVVWPVPPIRAAYKKEEFLETRNASNRRTTSIASKVSPLEDDCIPFDFCVPLQRF